LMPGIRERGIGGEGVVVVAGGISCRHQILDATGVGAVHPIEVVAEVMGLGKE